MECEFVFQVGQQMFIQPNTIHMLPNLIKTQPTMHDIFPCKNKKKMYVVRICNDDLCGILVKYHLKI